MALVEKYMFSFVKNRRIFYILSIVLTVASLTCIFVFGLKFGIDFTGGSVLTIEYQQAAPSLEQVREALKDSGLGDFSVQKEGVKGIILKSNFLNEQNNQQILQQLEGLGNLTEGSQSFQSVGPVVGKEFRGKTKVFVILSLLIILIYIAISFRKISRPVKSYIYSVTSIVALIHDVLVPLGVFAVLGRLYGIEVTVPIITALLTVFGYSINDTVVVFDRVRENLLRSRGESLDAIVDKSLHQTLTRSINTVLTVLIVLFAIFFLGGATLRYFSLALILGVSLGAYSSIFLATPLVLSYFHLRERK